MNNEKKKKRFQVPNTYILIAFVVLVIAILSWIVPPGSFDYEQVDVNGTMRNIAIDGSFHYLEEGSGTPTGPLRFFASFYNGCMEAADIIFIIFICAGAMGVILKTGAFHAGIGALLRKMGNKDVLLVVIFMFVFGLGGTLFGMLEEFYAFVPLFVGLGVAMGYDAMFGMAIIALGSYMGFMGATMNPYTVGVAQAIAGVPLYSGTAFRAICFVTFEIAGILYILNYGRKIKKHPELSVVYGDKCIHAFSKEDLDEYQFDKKKAFILLEIVVLLAIVMWGMMTQGWWFAELAAFFVVMSIIAAVVEGWSGEQYIDAFVDSIKDVVWGAMLTGVAKAIVVVMQDAMIMDTIIYFLSNLMNGVPSALAAEAMLVLQTFINFLVPSGSGQAAATMPIMAPLADVLGVSRQTAVLAFQFGDGLSNLLWPTCGCVVICGFANIPLQKWWKFFIPFFFIIFALQATFVAISCFIW